MGDLPDKDALRAEMEATRGAYHQLLSSLSQEDWGRKSGNPDMTVKDLMWHVAWAMGWLSGSVDAVKAGRRLWLPPILVDPLRALAMRWLARNVTQEVAARKYDEGYNALLEKLVTVSGGDWLRSARRFGETRTVEWCFKQPALHFEEHAADVRLGLGRE